MKIRFVIFSLLFACLFLFIYLASQPYTVKFSKDFYYDYESNSIFGKIELIDIPPEILEFNYDKKFVIVKQRPKYINDSIYDYPKDYTYTHGLKTDYYWLILLTENKVYGPMIFEDFNALCDERKIGLKFN